MHTLKGSKYTLHWDLKDLLAGVFKYMFLLSTEMVSSVQEVWDLREVVGKLYGRV